jgi:hypothetical protein
MKSPEKVEEDTNDSELADKGNIKMEYSSD